MRREKCAKWMHKENPGAMPMSLPRRNLNNVNYCWVVWVKMPSQVDSSNEAMKRVRELEATEANEIHSLFLRAVRGNLNIVQTLV
jgi:hypothetical protein